MLKKTDWYGDPRGSSEVMASPAPSAKAIEPVPRDQWPLWARAVAQKARLEHIGVGDTVFYTIGPSNSARFHSWFHATFKIECGCAERRKLWNQLYPYDHPSTA